MNGSIHDHCGVTRSIRILAAVAATLIATSTVHGQNAVVTVSGRIIDRNSGEPLPGATVEMPELDRYAIADAEGRFTFRKVTPGSYTAHVYQLGYAALDQVWNVTREPSPLTIALAPEPILLEGLTIVTDRFMRRRKAHPQSVHVYERDQLGSVVGLTMRDFVLRRTALHPASCPSGGPGCVWFRGRPIRPIVYIDESPAIGGLTQLGHYRPDEIHMVEVYGSGRHIRVYTAWFMQRVARSGIVPEPIALF